MKRAWLPLLALALGCGYHFTAGGPPLPEGIRSVEVPIYGNKTAEPGLETVFTEAMRTQLLRAGLDGAPAQAQILGEILSVGGGPTLITKAGTLASYRIYCTVHLRLVKGAKTLADIQVNGTEDYLPGVGPGGGSNGEILEAETNRAEALHRLADALARDGYERLATGW